MFLHFVHLLDSTDFWTVFEMATQELKVLHKVLVGDVVHLVRAVLVPCVAEECVEDEDDADGPDEPVQTLSVLHESLVPHRDVVEVSEVEIETRRECGHHEDHEQTPKLFDHVFSLGVRDLQSVNESRYFQDVEQAEHVNDVEYAGHDANDFVDVAVQRSLLVHSQTDGQDEEKSTDKPEYEDGNFETLRGLVVDALECEPDEAAEEEKGPQANAHVDSVVVGGAQVIHVDFFSRQPLVALPGDDGHCDENAQADGDHQVPHATLELS